MVNRNASKGSPAPPTTPQDAGRDKDEKNKKIPGTTSGKKMKQTRLSFGGAKEDRASSTAPNDASAAASGGGSDGLRKRKLSSPDADRPVKAVRREKGKGKQSEDPDPVVILDDDEKNEEVVEIEEKCAAEPVVCEDDNVEMVEIVPCEEENSNSVAAPSSADVSVLIEDDGDDDNEEQKEEQPEDTEEPPEEEEKAKEDQVEDGDSGEDQAVNESINLDNSSSEDGGADNIANMLEPPTNNGNPLTPRQLEKLGEKKSKQEERLRQKMEKEKKVEEEKRQKELQKKKEREEREEAKRKEREEKEAARLKEKEEKEAAKLKEKEEKERKKQLEVEQKNEEKRRKEEQKEEERRKKEELKEEEKRKKEEEKRQKEIEEDNKRKRASQAFTKFFKVGPKTADGGEGSSSGVSAERGETGEADDVVEVVNQNFMPFALKADMKLAPTVRRLLTKEAKGALDKILSQEESDSVQHLYLKSLKTKSHVPMKCVRTWRVSDSSDDESEDELMIVDEEVAHKVEDVKPKKQKYRAKRLMFKENRRPAYYGTWMKRSKVVGPRRPFAKDEKFFDYEVESDDEWEEEEPGESLHGSEDEKEKESEDDYEVDNEFFVPHGHLSDEEMQSGEDNEMDDNTPEVQKVKLKLLQDEFNVEMKKKTEKIKPRLIGCIWTDEKGGRPDNCPEVFWELLKFRAVLSAGPIVLHAPTEAGSGEQSDADAEEEEKVDKRKGQGLNEAEVRDLIRLVHGNLNSNKFIVKEYQVFLEKKAAATATAPAEATPRAISNMTILRKIKEIAKWENATWVVQKEFLEQHGHADLPQVNAWEYALTPKRVRTEKKAVPESPQVNNGQNSQPGTEASAATATAPKTPIRPAVEKESPPSAKQPQQQQKTNRNSITQFTKVLTTEEKQKQFQQFANVSSPKQTVSAGPSSTVTTGAPVSTNENKAPTPIAVKRKSEPLEKTSSSTTSPANPPPAKKRVPLLMSVPRGQAISEQSKSLLIKNFLTKKVTDQETGGPGESVDKVQAKDPVVTETIVLD